MNFKNILLTLTFLLYFLFLNVSSIQAQEELWQNPSEQTTTNDVVQESSDVTNAKYRNHGIKTDLNIYNVMIFGADENNAQAQAVYPGVIKQVGNLTAMMIEKLPVSSTEYIADLGSNLGLPIKSAYAQGIGWQALEPIMDIWRAFRNVVYLFFVFIFILVGFMIMFRAKINPQTVVSIEAALPKIVITLLLVTFSYAIAGLMIDLIYIGIYLIVGVLYLGGLLTDTQTPINEILSRNPFNMVFMKNGADIFIQAPGDAIEGLISGLFGDWVDDINGLKDVIGAIGKLVLGLGILFQMFKLFFSLLLSYLSIVLSVILSPFNILFNALPGSNAFASWLKSLFANIIVFPAVAGLFLIGAVLIGTRGGAECGSFDNPWCVAEGIGYYPQAANPEGSVWIPPFLSMGGQGQAGAGSIQVFQALIALGIIMMAPQVVTMIKKALKVEGSGFGGAILGGIMAGPSMITKIPATGYDLLAKGQYIGLIKPFGDSTRKPYVAGAQGGKPA